MSDPQADLVKNFEDAPDIIQLENVSVSYRLPSERIGTLKNMPFARCSGIN